MISSNESSAIGAPKRKSRFITWAILGVVCAGAIGAGSFFFIHKEAPAPKVYHIGVLEGLTFLAPVADGFKAKMSDLGYVEGKNVTYDLQATDFDVAAYKRILQQFVAEKADLIVVFPTEATIEAKAIAQSAGIPVVFAFVNIEGTDLVESARAPGGAMTGVRYPGPDIALKRYEILHRIVPNAKRILIPYQRGYPIVQSQLDVIRPVAQKDGVAIIELPADNAAELASYFDAQAKLTRPGFDAILAISEPLMINAEAGKIVLAFAAAHKTPIGGRIAGAGDYGGLFDVSGDSHQSGMQAAFLAQKVLSGVDAGTIPVVSANRVTTVNPGMAAKIGVTIPADILNSADAIVQ